MSNSQDETKLRKKHARKKPDWNNAITNLSAYKATPQELERKKLMYKSKHAESAKVELMKRKLFKPNSAYRERTSALKDSSHDSDESQDFESLVTSPVDRRKFRQKAKYVSDPIVTPAPQMSPSSPRGMKEYIFTVSGSSDSLEPSSQFESKSSGDAVNSAPDEPNNMTTKNNFYNKIIYDLDKEREHRQSLAMEVYRHGVIIDLLKKEILRMKDYTKMDQGNFDDLYYSTRLLGQDVGSNFSGSDSSYSGHVASRHSGLHDGYDSSGKTRKGSHSLPDVHQVESKISSTSEVDADDKYLSKWNSAANGQVKYSTVENSEILPSDVHPALMLIKPEQYDVLGADAKKDGNCVFSISALNGNVDNVCDDDLHVSKSIQVVMDNSNSSLTMNDSPRSNSSSFVLASEGSGNNGTPSSETLNNCHNLQLAEEEEEIYEQKVESKDGCKLLDMESLICKLRSLK